jgi:hypothetical protein
MSKLAPIFVLKIDLATLKELGREVALLLRSVAEQVERMTEMDPGIWSQGRIWQDLPSDVRQLVGRWKVIDSNNPNDQLR